MEKLFAEFLLDFWNILIIFRHQNNIDSISIEINFIFAIDAQGLLHCTIGESCLPIFDTIVPNVNCLFAYYKVGSRDCGRLVTATQMNEAQKKTHTQTHIQKKNEKSNEFHIIHIKSYGTFLSPRCRYERIPYHFWPHAITMNTLRSLFFLSRAAFEWNEIKQNKYLILIKIWIW